MHMMFLRLMDDNLIDPPITLLCLSDEDITVIYNVIKRPGYLVGGRMPDKGYQFSVLVVKNLKLVMFMFKTSETSSRPHDINGAYLTSIWHLPEP